MPILPQQLIVANYEPFSTLNQNWTMTNALFVIAGEPSHRHWRLLVSIVTTRGFNCAPHLVSIGHHTTLITWPDDPPAELWLQSSTLPPAVAKSYQARHTLCVTQWWPHTSNIHFQPSCWLSLSWLIGWFIIFRSRCEWNFPPGTSLTKSH